MTLIDYDIHTAVCDPCGNVCTGTSADSRDNLPNFKFDYNAQLFICEGCGKYCKAYYDEWNDKEHPDDDDVRDVTAQIMPAQHAMNTVLDDKQV